MTPDELDDLLNTAHERQNLEVKSSGPLDSRTKFSAKIVRAIMGLSNLRDGGAVVVGVSEGPNGVGLSRDGLAAQDLGTWDNDRLSTVVNNHADPSVQTSVEHVELDGRDFVAIRVHPFRETPTVCKKPWSIGQDLVLRKGAVYVRSLRKTETREVSTSEDMRALLQLALEKQLADYVGTAQRAGVDLTAGRAEPSDLDQFEAELGELA